MLVGGGSAQEADLRTAAAQDTRLIVPLALAVVFVILVLLLRALVAPLLLMATVVLSFAAALGIGSFFATEVFGFAGLDPSYPLFVFVFLVALGIDYNIFLMARVREETVPYGTRTGMLRGLAVTGAVITSAGIVLAGTFSGPGRAAARVPHRARLHDRDRRAARHVPRALDPRARAHVRLRRPRVVAVTPVAPRGLSGPGARARGAAGGPAADQADACPGRGQSLSARHIALMPLREPPP